MKLYLSEFEYKYRPGKKWYKYGYVLQGDAAKRFAGNEYTSRFNIKILCSIKISHSNYAEAVNLCKEVEEMFKNKYPKNFILEEYLGLPHGFFNNPENNKPAFSGITEMFILPNEQEARKKLIGLFFKAKKIVESNPRYQNQCNESII